MTTNTVKFWYNLLKTHLSRKEIMENFSLLGLISYILTIDN